MKGKKQRSFSKLDEHFLVPLLWFFITATIISFIYLLTEYFTPTHTFKEYYRFDASQILGYKRRLLILASAFCGLLALQYLSLVLKNRWIYLIVMLGNSVAFYKLGWVL